MYTSTFLRAQLDLTVFLPARVTSFFVIRAHIMAFFQPNVTYPPPKVSLVFTIILFCTYIVDMHQARHHGKGVTRGPRSLPRRSVPYVRSLIALLGSSIYYTTGAWVVARAHTQEWKVCRPLSVAPRAVGSGSSVPERVPPYRSLKPLPWQTYRPTSLYQTH